MQHSVSKLNRGEAHLRLSHYDFPGTERGYDEWSSEHLVMSLECIRRINDDIFQTQSSTQTYGDLFYIHGAFEGTGECCRYELRILQSLEP